jgi:hypothetical protein
LAEKLGSLLADTAVSWPAIGEVLVTGGLLKVADCVVPPGHEDRFRQVEEHVWLPGTASVDGILRGPYSQVGE